MQLSDAVDEYLLACAHHSAKTLKWYQQKLRDFVTWYGSTRQVDAVETRELRQYLAFKDDGISSYTLHGYGQVLKGFFSWLLAEGIIGDSPARRLSLPRVDIKVIHILSREDITRLKLAARQSQFPLRDMAVLALLLDTGIRSAECRTLTLDKMHLIRGDAYIEVRGKGRKERQVGLSPAVVALLHRYITTERRALPHISTVFVKRDGTALDERGLHDIFSRLNERAHISGVRVSPHTCRHTFALTFLRAGGNLFHLSRLLGHSSVKTTENYLRDFNHLDTRHQPVSVFGLLN